eukprot:102039-Pelagomonas_calceolata.AAC.1
MVLSTSSVLDKCCSVCLSAKSVAQCVICPCHRDTLLPPSTIPAIITASSNAALHPSSGHHQARSFMQTSIRTHQQILDLNSPPPLHPNPTHGVRELRQMAAMNSSGREQGKSMSFS